MGNNGDRVSILWWCLKVKHNSTLELSWIVARFDLCGEASQFRTSFCPYFSDDPQWWFNDLQWLILLWSLVMAWNHQPSNPVFSAESSAFCRASSRLEEAVVHGIWRWHRVANIFDLRWSKPEPDGLASILENPWNGVYGVLMGLGFRLILDFKPSLIWTCNQSIQIQSKNPARIEGRNYGWCDWRSNFQRTQAAGTNNCWTFIYKSYIYI